MESVALTFTQDSGGRPNFKHSSGFLHSVRDPEAEAARSLTPLSTSRAQTILIVGIGWGYVVLANKRANTLYYEPSQVVRDALVATGRLDELTADGARILADKTSLNYALQECATLDVLITPAYKRLFPALEKEIEDVGFEEGTSDAAAGSVNARTTRRFFNVWLRTGLGRLRAGGALKYVKGFSAIGPVLFCGAGPGLDADLESLPAIAKAGILCADTALAPLLARGIRPDLVLSVDTGSGTAYHTAAALAVRRSATALAIPCLTWLGGATSLSAFFSDVYFYRTTFPLDQMCALGGALGAVPEWKNPALNVAGLALNIAAACGRADVFFAGTDFLSEGGVSHTRGTGYAYYAMTRSSRTWPLEMYRPGGYGSQLTEKNRGAVEGMDALGRSLGVQPRKLAREIDAFLAQAEEAQRPRDRPMVGKVSPRLSIQSVTIAAKAMVEAVQSTREKVDYESIAREAGSEPSDMERWKRWMQSM